MRTHRCPPSRSERHTCHYALVAWACERPRRTAMLRTGPPGWSASPSSGRTCPRQLTVCCFPSAPSILAATQAAAYLAGQGYAVPAWDDAHSAPPGPSSRNDEPAGTLRGWQRGAAHACDERALETHLADPSPASRALLLSQAGPHAARVFTVLPTSDVVAVPDPHFRVLLLRRLRLPLPLGPRACSCRGFLD